jgi:hypothetical protein
MGTEKDSTKRLLEACGSGKAPPALPGSQGQQREKYFEAMLAKADIAAKLAQQAQGETEKNYQKLNSFLEHDLPGRLQSAFEKVAREQVNQILNPLHSGISQLASTLNECTAATESLTWNRRIIMIGVITGMITVSMGTWVVRSTLLDPKIDEIIRWDVYGRRVAENIEKLPPKEREKLYNQVGGRP